MRLGRCRILVSHPGFRPMASRADAVQSNNREKMTENTNRSGHVQTLWTSGSHSASLRSSNSRRLADAAKPVPMRPLRTQADGEKAVGNLQPDFVFIPGTAVKPDTFC